MSAPDARIKFKLRSQMIDVKYITIVTTHNMQKIYRGVIVVRVPLIRKAIFSGVPHIVP